MPAPVITVVEAYRSVQYDGGNGSDVVAELPDAKLYTDDGHTLRLGMYAGKNLDGADVVHTHDLTAGQWIVWRAAHGAHQVYGVLDDATYRALWTPVQS